MAAFWLGLVALERQSVANRLAAGAMFGLLYHAKPQGLFFPILFALTVMADAVIAASGVERIKKVLMHWLTAAGCAAVLGLRWLEILAFEQQDHPWSISAFLGSYAGRAFGDLPFQWAGFGMMLAGHLVLLTISCGILPVLNLGPELLSALRGKSAGRRGQLALMAAATVLVTTVASARHTIIADADWSIYERYLMIVHPLLFILFAANRMKPCSGWVRAGGWLAAVLVLTGAALTAHALQWHLWGDLPSLSGVWLVLDDRQKLSAVWATTGGLIALPALLLLAQRSRIGRWSFGLRAWTVAWLLLVMNFGYYITAQTVHKPMTQELHSLARQITRVVPKGKRLMIVMDDMPLSLYFQVASRVPDVPVCLASSCDWFIRPMQLSPTAVPDPPGNLGDFWLLTNAHWHFIGKPAKRIDHYNLYDLGVYPPPRLSVPQVAVEIARKMPMLLSPTVDGFRKEFELSWLDIRLPRSLRAGDTVTVKATVRNDSPFPIGSGVQRLGLGYHWANPELTGNWTAVVWDDGNYTWLPEEMPSGQTMEIAVHVAVQERAGKGWLLTLCPVLVNEHYRLWPDSRRCKSLDGLTIAPNQHPSTG